MTERSSPPTKSSSSFNDVNCIADGLRVELESDRVDAARASAQMTP